MATEAKKRTTVGAWVPLSVADQLRARAAEGDRSVSADVRRAVIAHLKAERPRG